MYFVMKEAVYMHGIAWIGFDKNEGIRQAEIFAQCDIDRHHDWNLYQYVWQDPSPDDRLSYLRPLEHKLIYSTEKGKAGREQWLS